MSLRIMSGKLWRNYATVSRCVKKNSYFFFFILFFLQIFKTMMLEFSSDMPCIANVIPAMDQMHANLLAACDNEDYSTTIHAALK